MSRRVLLSLAMMLPVVALIATSHLLGAPAPVPTVCAACTQLPNCGVEDLTLTSVLAAAHADPQGEYTISVEPNTGETWSITAYWSPPQSSGPCECMTGPWATVTAVVTWTDGTGWSVSCTGCNPSIGPIKSVAICNAGSCGGQTELNNGYAYKLLVDINRTWFTWRCPIDEGIYDPVLEKVVYTTTSVDNGNVIDQSVNPCTEGSSVSPTSQTWSDTDDAAFECGISCDYTGAQVEILYQ